MQKIVCFKKLEPLCHPALPFQKRIAKVVYCEMVNKCLPEYFREGICLFKSH